MEPILFWDIFVTEHYLLRVNYEPRGTENGHGQKSEHTFKPEAIVFITLKTFLQTTGF